MCQSWQAELHLEDESCALGSWRNVIFYGLNLVVLRERLARKQGTIQESCVHRGKVPELGELITRLKEDLGTVTSPM